MRPTFFALLARAPPPPPHALTRAPPPLALIPAASHAPTFWLARAAFLHWLGGVYVVAWLIALRQNRPLLGADGLLPVDAHLARCRERGESFAQRPSLFWWVPRRRLDAALDVHALLGLGLALPVALSGAAALPQMLALWALYLLLTNVGQRWYSSAGSRCCSRRASSPCGCVRSRRRAASRSHCRRRRWRCGRCAGCSSACCSAPG